MSHQQNDLYLEELQEAEQDYLDDLKSLIDARRDLREALDWENKMYENTQASSKKLQALKNRE